MIMISLAHLMSSMMILQILVPGMIRLSFAFAFASKEEVTCSCAFWQAQSCFGTPFEMVSDPALDCCFGTAFVIALFQTELLRPERRYT